MPAKRSYITLTDQFCGAGGSSQGAAATGKVHVALALNHWKLAVETHNTNFPNTAHDCVDISATDPRRYPSTDILITSPECTNHSLAKGNRSVPGQMNLFNKTIIDPAIERSRATMWDVVRFSEYHRYNIIIVENVVDARSWVLFPDWLKAMHTLGYEHEAVYLNSMFAHPTPQSRDRMYIVFWRRGNKRPDLNLKPLAFCAHCGRNVNAVQSWKNPQRRYGRYKQSYVYRCDGCHQVVEPYYYAAANAIDWFLPTPRIGDRPRPLKERTLERVRIGLERFGEQSLIVPLTYTHGHNERAKPLTDPIPTHTARQDMGLAITPTPFLSVQFTPGYNLPVNGAAATVTTQDHQALVVPHPYIVEMHGRSDVRSTTEALSTVATSGAHHGLAVPPFIIELYNTGTASGIHEALATVTAGGNHHGLVTPKPFLVSYYGTGGESGVDETVPTVTTLERHALVRPQEKLRVEDCGFRMLQPHEIQAAMAFPPDYIVLGTNRDKVRQLGNAVTPPVMTWLVDACVGSLEA